MRATVGCVCWSLCRLDGEEEGGANVEKDDDIAIERDRMCAGVYGMGIDGEWGLKNVGIRMVVQ